MNLQIIALAIMLFAATGVSVGIAVSRCNRRISNIIINSLTFGGALALGILFLIALEVI